MCGIIGVYGQGHEYKDVEKALTKIIHRGTKNFEIKQIDYLSTLGANRLPIVGREGGMQPVSSGDEMIWAVLNGEIFNYLDLKKDLESKGYVFKTKTDTEVLIYLYKEYGHTMMQHIDSEMFAFIIYDAEKKQILAARDPIGVKPLYYASDSEQNLWFFSELKEVSDWESITEIHSVAPGEMFYHGHSGKYFNYSISKVIDSEKVIEDQLSDLIENAVKKRVQTDLPLAVLLSGGVDSSLIMHFANKHHHDVTAFILGTPTSSDYKAAVKFCKENNYKYKVVEPDANYLDDLDKVIYYAEAFEPNIIRHCFASHMIARAIHEAGHSIALCGEGSDELFAGYNEFTQIDPGKISLASQKMIETLGDSNLQRVDRMSMRHTLEVRVPFLDTEIVNFALSLNPDLKVRNENGKIITKYILRKVANKFLPDDIAWRHKEPFANGAGMDVGLNYKKEDGEIVEYIKTLSFTHPSDEEIREYALVTLEDKYYFSKFKEFHYTKLIESKNRAFMKDTLPEIFR